ncbi:MAG: Transcriptional regulator, AcrR family, partial [uncultured Thermomicrobiales bacterium]
MRGNNLGGPDSGRDLTARREGAGDVVLTHFVEPMARPDWLYCVRTFGLGRATRGCERVTTEYSGRGDPARSLALLWEGRKEPTRGPKPGLSLERIVRAAIEVADAEGLAVTSMRRVAERLGVGAMSLYTYVPGKAELLDVMLDTVFGEEPGADDPAGGWRAGLERRARQDSALYRRHPWVLQVSSARSVLGPNEIAIFESSLRTVSGIGLDGGEMVAVVSLVGGYVRGAAQGAIEAALAAQRTGLTDDQWWAARAPLLEKYFDPARYPIVSSVQQSGAFDGPADGADYNLQRTLDEFEFGLQRVLDG